MTPNESLREFFEDVPALGLLGTPHCIYPQTPFVVDADVQLVCKYLKAYRIGGTKGIDRLYRESELTVWYTASVRVINCVWPAISFGVLPVRDYVTLTHNRMYLLWILCSSEYICVP